MDIEELFEYNSAKIGDDIDDLQDFELLAKTCDQESFLMIRGPRMRMTLSGSFRQHASKNRYFGLSCRSSGNTAPSGSR